MRVALFGTGSPLSTAAFRALSSHAAAAVVVPAGPSPLRGPRALRRWVATRRAAGPLVRLARAAGAPLHRFAERDEARLAIRLAAAGTEVFCVASFPRLLPAGLLGSAPRGAVGLHLSLLPRHRGPDPLFWTYVHDDPAAGITVHWLDAGEDTGDVIFQAAVPLDRGRDVADLYTELSRRGAELLERALGAIVSGTAPRQPQDAGSASREAAPARAGWRIDFDSWGARRVWHVLAGLGAWRPLLFDGERGLRHGRALGFTIGSCARPPGTVERSGSGWRVHCRDGTVDVAARVDKRARLP